MGYVRVKARIWNIEDPSYYRDIELLADTRIMYTVIPANILNELGIKVIGKRKFRLANNEVIERCGHHRH